jgi:hypothetical protein
MLAVVRLRLASLLFGALALLAAGCGTASTVSSTGNLKTCEDFFAYGSFLQSIKSPVPQSTVFHELQALENRLTIDGPTAQSRALAETARRAVQAIKAKNGQAIAREMNASTTDCELLGHLPPESSVSG